MSIEQLAQLGLDDSAYVWHSGLPDWVKITSVPELNEMLMASNAQQHDVDDQQVPQLPQQQQCDDLIDDEASNITEPNIDANQPAPAAMQGNQYQQPLNGGYQQYAASQQAAEPLPDQPECPPSNLVWAIIATVFCCSIPGILGIVFAILTKKHYREGNLEKAQRMSDYGAWAVIISIILGIISMPISCAMNIAKMAM